MVSVFPNKAKKLHTTHSWDFMSLEKNGVVDPSSIWEKAKYGEDVIMANLDTGMKHSLICCTINHLCLVGFVLNVLFINAGVWPEAESFSDEGYGPIPSRWKGKCDHGDGFTCNRSPP